MKSSQLHEILTQHFPHLLDNSVANLKFLIGKNAENNWEIYKSSSQKDVIFHLDKFSSPYVIVNVSMDDLTPDQIKVAATICKLRSKYKNMKNIGVSYTPISNTILGQDVGSYIIRNNHKKKVIYV